VGVDTHGEVHVACALDQLGRQLATLGAATTIRGYRELLEWAQGLGAVQAFGVEGSGCYGAGLARFLTAHARSCSRSTGPTAKPAANRASPIPSTPRPRPGRCWPARPPPSPRPVTSIVEMVRCLRVARASAAKARTQTINALRALVVTAPAELREQLRELPVGRLVRTAVRLRPGPILTTEAATKLALRLLGERDQALEAELAAVDAELDRLTAQAAARLRRRCGVGPEIAGALLVAAGDNPGRLRSEAAFSMLCGASPIPASSARRCAIA
jgi:transposase